MAKAKKARAGAKAKVKAKASPTATAKAARARRLSQKAGARKTRCAALSISRNYEPGEEKLDVYLAPPEGAFTIPADWCGVHVAHDGEPTDIGRRFFDWFLPWFFRDGRMRLKSAWNAWAACFHPNSFPASPGYRISSLELSRNGSWKATCWPIRSWRYSGKRIYTTKSGSVAF